MRGASSPRRDQGGQGWDPRGFTPGLGSPPQVEKEVEASRDPPPPRLPPCSPAPLPCLDLRWGGARGFQNYPWDTCTCPSSRGSTAAPLPHLPQLRQGLTKHPPRRGRRLGVRQPHPPPPTSHPSLTRSGWNTKHPGPKAPPSLGPGPRPAGPREDCAPCRPRLDPWVPVGGTPAARRVRGALRAQRPLCSKGGRAAVS